MGELRIGIEARAFNATVRNRRQELGLTQRQLAELAGVHAHVVSGLETFRRPDLSLEVKKVLDALGLDEDASPAWIKELELYGTRRIERSVTPELAGLEPLLALPRAPVADDELDDVLDGVDRERILALLSKIPARERYILELRYGLHPAGRRLHERMGGDASWTLEEIGNELGVTPERVRQLEGEGIKRLRGLVRGYGLGEIREDDEKEE